MRYQNRRNVQWETAKGNDFTWEQASVEVLMDIREELQKLNSVMQCRNVHNGFRALAKIASRDEKVFKRRVECAVAKRIKRAT